MMALTIHDINGVGGYDFMILVGEKKNVDE